MAVKSMLTGLAVAFSMYSAIPVPQVRWEKSTMRWALCFLPLIGVLIGAVEWGWYRFCSAVGASALFYAVIAALLPLVLSGGIHLDGFTDSCDMFCSFGDREKRLAILHDPHVGAFGPMWLIAFLLAETACFAQLYETPALLPLACGGFALARTGGGRKIVAEECAKDSGLAHLFSENSDRRTVSAVMLAEAAVHAAAVLALLGRTGYTAAGVCYLLLVLWYLLHRRIAKRTVGGVTGDLAGFYISTAELLCLAAAAVGGLIG